MKTLNYFLFSIFSICLITACDVSQAGDEVQEENQSVENLALENSFWYQGKKHRKGKLPIKRDQVLLPLMPTFLPVVPA